MSALEEGETNMYPIKKIVAGMSMALLLSLGVGCGSLTDALNDLKDQGNGTEQDQSAKTHVKGTVASVPGADGSVSATTRGASAAMTPVRRVSKPRSLQYQYEYFYSHETDDSSEYEQYTEQYEEDDYGYDYDSEYEYSYEYCGYNVYEAEEMDWEDDDESSEEDGLDEVADEDERKTEEGDLDFSNITVFAMDAEGNRTSASCSADGSFDLALTIGKSYVIGFSDGTNFLGVLTFATDASGTLGGSSIHLSGISDVIDLGAITISDGLASCENNPMEDEDQDADGVSDFEDEDFEYEESYSCESTYIYEHYHESGTWGDDEECSNDDEVCILDDEDLE